MCQLKEIYGFSESQIKQIVKFYKYFSLQKFKLKTNNSFIEIKYTSLKDKNLHKNSSESYMQPDNSFHQNNILEKHINNKGSLYEEILSPISGTFYQAPSPGANAFVKVGDLVEPGTIMCIVEAMKNMNEVKSNISGKIAKVLVHDEELVQSKQALFLIDTAST